MTVCRRVISVTVPTRVSVILITSPTLKGLNEIIKIPLTKLPNASGSYVCPASQTLLSNANDTVGWTDALCCHKTGLCQGNTVSSHDVQCPVGQIIKQIYYINIKIFITKNLKKN